MVETKLEYGLLSINPTRNGACVWVSVLIIHKEALTCEASKSIFAHLTLALALFYSAFAYYNIMYTVKGVAVNKVVCPFKDHLVTTSLGGLIRAMVLYCTLQQLQ